MPEQDPEQLPEQLEERPGQREQPGASAACTRTRLPCGADRRIDAGVLVIEGLETAQRNALYTAGLATRRSLRTKATFLVGSTASGGCLCEVLPN